MKYLTKLFSACLLLSACSACFAAEEVYSFGVVPQFETRKLYTIWKPILETLEQRTGLRFKLIGTADISIFEQQFSKGVYDFAYMNPFHVLNAHSTQGYVPIVRDGTAQTRGILVVKKDSPVTTVQQLSGTTIAFPSRNALGASLLVRAMLEQRGVLDYASLFVGTHSSVYLHVLHDLAAAGGGVDTTLRLQPEEVRDGLRVILTTDGFPPHPVVAHRRVPAAIRQKVQEAFLAMADTAAGRQLLANIPMPSPVPATMDDYQALKKMHLERWAVPLGQPSQGR